MDIQEFTCQASGVPLVPPTPGEIKHYKTWTRWREYQEVRAPKSIPTLVLGMADAAYEVGNVVFVSQPMARLINSCWPQTYVYCMTVVLPSAVRFGKERGHIPRAADVVNKLIEKKELMDGTGT
jgi:hypothetical protein